MSLDNIETRLITSTAQLQEMDKLMMSTELVAIDSETDGLHRFRKAIGFSFSVNENTGFYVPLLVWKDGGLVSPWKDDKPVRAALKKWFSDKKKKWILHNAPFDVIVVHNEFNIWITDNVFSDTKLLHHTCISEEPPHGLKPLSVKHIGPDADKSQKDLEDSVKANGGAWNKKDREIWKADTNLLGTYASFDTVLTYRLHQLFYPEIEKQGLQDLWFKEVLPLNKVVVELNSVGLDIDVPYYENLAVEMEQTIAQIESEVYELAKEDLSNYEYLKITREVNITSRSELGKLLKKNGYDLGSLSLFDNEVKKFVIDWYKSKKKVDKIFNLDSGDDKAFLLYRVLGFECPKKTKSGKPAVDKRTLEELLEQQHDNEIVKKIQLRAKERKTLSTYVLPLIENHVNGRVYPQFNQTGTVSGRFTSSEPINFQTLPKDDLRIKKGIIAGKGCKLIELDYESLEAKIFSALSTDPELISIYTQGYDFYSKIAIDVEGCSEYSPSPKDDNFLKRVAPEKRQKAKTYALGLAYGMQKYKLAVSLNISPDEAQHIIDSYFTKYASLRKFMDESMATLIETGEVRSIAGRKKRARIIPLIQTHFNRVNIHNSRELEFLYPRTLSVPEFISYYEAIGSISRPKGPKDFAYLVRNELNHSINYKMQSAAASLMNAACIEFYERRKSLGARMALQVHDSVVLLVENEEAESSAALMQDCMENNYLTKKIVVPMTAKPNFGFNLAETK